MKASMLTKIGSGPSDLDSDIWHRILTSGRFGIATTDLVYIFTQQLKVVRRKVDLKSSLTSPVAC